ncbi:hypothetical protein [Thalassoroseus pseudoceratinae]|uniref:hypothetical protein n=1 Tax=Thalassoroseus pseudoceratinae TaxID=2713176 RepID=UPI001420C501|nr:hypothetical protein [Thalassoroseus pseudoceratinae]
MPNFFAGLLIGLLIVMHQMDWHFPADALLFDRVPMALVYHGVVSILSAIAWYLVVQVCWPTDAEVLEPAPTNEEPS